MCTFWLVEALTRAGQAFPEKLDQARLVFERMLGYANHLGLYAEQTGAQGEALGNFPQAFTHLALISAAFNLDRTLSSRKYGAVSLLAHSPGIFYTPLHEKKLTDDFPHVSRPSSRRLELRHSAPSCMPPPKPILVCCRGARPPIPTGLWFRRSCCSKLKRTGLWRSSLHLSGGFPNVAVLASSELVDVLTVWQGLGYNRRALALKRAAEAIVTRFGGRVPINRQELESLPGIGPYTAGAILAFAYNRPAVFIETNIRSVFHTSFFPGYRPHPRQGPAATGGKDHGPSATVVLVQRSHGLRSGTEAGTSQSVPQKQAPSPPVYFRGIEPATAECPAQSDPCLSRPVIR